MSAQALPVLSATVRIYQHGRPDVLQLEDIEVAAPGPGEVRISQSAIGLNFADIYQRRGSHGPHGAAPFPITLGAQGAGVIDAIGAEVTGFFVGQSVAYFHPGAYQAIRNVPAARVIALPKSFSEELAGANLLRGMTAEYLLRRLHVVQKGEAVLIHAAAGGMGVILSQWARALGALVIGTVGSDEKKSIALNHGCHHVINYRREDFAQETLTLTGHQGVSVVYDAVGKDVFVDSLACMRPLGMAINYGTASGDVEGFDLQRLHAKSLSICRPTLRSFIATSEDLQRSAHAFFEATREGIVKLEVNRRYALADVRRAHEELEGRTTVGAPILIP